MMIMSNVFAQQMCIASFDIVKDSMISSSPYAYLYIDKSVGTTIVSWTWDFGDGEIKKNLSQSIMQHTYTYNSAAENGAYTPKVTVTTKKWLTGMITTTYPITVKKKTATLAISVDSHPSQVARIGDRVSYSLELNGVPKSIVWDFGNGKTLQCSNRECIQATTTYDTPGKYTVQAKVTYDNSPEIDGNIAIKVQ